MTKSDWITQLLSDWITQLLIDWITQLLGEWIIHWVGGVKCFIRTKIPTNKI